MPCPFYQHKKYFDIEEYKIRKAMSDDNGTLLEINLAYPQIKLDDGKFEKTFNSFYSSINSNYTAYCEKKLIPKIKVIRDKQNDSFKTYGEIMKYYITLNTEKYLSVVTDIKHYNGYFTDCIRFSCVWDVSSCTVLPYTYFFEKVGLTVKKVRETVFKRIVDELSEDNCQFDYTEDRIKRYAKRINPKNYFLTERGIALWFDCGTLAPKGEGFPTYIIECEFDK